MSLANFLLRAALGNYKAPDKLEIALFDGGREVKDPNYRRHTVPKGTWNISNERASTTATFGPFAGSVTFDRSIVYQGATIVDEKRLPGEPRKSGTSDVVRLTVELDLTAPEDKTVPFGVTTV